MATAEQNRLYARLAVREGVNVQKGQTMVIIANARDYEFVRLCTEEAYEAGAGHVSVSWEDDITGRMRYVYESVESLREVPQWLYDREKYFQDKGSCRLNIASDIPGLLADVDPGKVQARAKAYREKTADLQHFYMNNRAQWCVISLPSAGWAKVVFPELAAEEALKQLEGAVFNACRVRGEEDPAPVWRAHDEALHAYADKMNGFGFSALHFASKETGTDLTVGLVDNHIWVGGSGEDVNGVRFSPNIPSEEVFTMPDRMRADGFVRVSKPLNYHGRLIHGLWLHFENGRVVESGADKEAELLSRLLDFDEGSRHLGEVALVPYDSPISKSGILFYETLFDENAACHLALGRCYPENLKGGGKMETAELAGLGGNDSLQHEDFMIGTKDMEIDGIGKDGERTPVFRAGNFVI